MQYLVYIYFVSNVQEERDSEEKEKQGLRNEAQEKGYGVPVVCECIEQQWSQECGGE